MIDVIVDGVNHRVSRLQPDAALEFDVANKEINICDVSKTKIFTVEIVANYMSDVGIPPCNEVIREISLKTPVSMFSLLRLFITFDVIIDNP